MYEAVFAPGDAYLKHRLAREEMYYIKSGRSLAGVGDKRAEVGAGDYHLVLAGVEHWLVNTDTAPLIGPGVYIGVSGLEASGYVHHGPVTQDDLDIDRGPNGD